MGLTIESPTEFSEAPSDRFPADFRYSSLAKFAPTRESPFGKSKINSFREENQKQERTDEEKEKKNAPEVLDRQVLKVRSIIDVFIQRGVQAILLSQREQALSNIQLGQLPVHTVLQV